MFDQTCFNRLATHFNISMFGHQTMFDDVWSPNISRLDRPHSSSNVKLVKSIRNESFNTLVSKLVDGGIEYEVDFLHKLVSS